MTKKSFYIHGNYACFYPGQFSQWHKSLIEDGNMEFCCAEQALMYKKAQMFNDQKIMQMLLKTANPREHKHLGRQVANFDNKKWEQERQNIAVQINFLKFTQNEYLRKLLLSTNDLILVEASPHDTIWGIGRGLDFPHLDDKTQWRGQNILGYVLTEVKQKIKNL